MNFSSAALRELAKCVVLGIVVAAIVFFSSGRANGQVGAFHDSDFDAFDAADSILRADGNPYLVGSIDEELLAGGDRYSPDFTQYPGAQSRLFFNPPIWLSMLTLMGFSSNVLVVGGAFLTGSACAALSRRDPVILLAFPGLFLLWDRLFLWANAGFGQTGYLIAGGMLWSLVALRSNRAGLAGLAGSLLSCKPHLWLSHLVGVSSGGRKAPLWQFLFSAAFGLLSVAHLGWLVWRQYVEGILSISGETPTTQSLTFTVLAPFMENRSAVALTALFALAAVYGVARSSLRFEAKWIITVALLMMASTHAFWHDWAWLLAVPLLLDWRKELAVGFYLLVPMVSLVSNTGPAFVVLGMIALIVWNENTSQPASSQDHRLMESSAERNSVLIDGSV